MNAGDFRGLGAHVGCLQCANWAKMFRIPLCMSIHSTVFIPSGSVGSTLLITSSQRETRGLGLGDH